MPAARIAVIGAGLAGLAAAYELARTPGIAVTLYEASERLGGTIETVTMPSEDGAPFVVECGPDSWVSDKPAARALAIELGLEDELIQSNDARRRNYLARPGLSPARGELVPMPDGMRMMVPTRWAPILESPLFSWQARLAYLREPKRAAELKQHALAQPQDHDESVGTFIRRHFGDEATLTIAGPLLAGVFGGDIETLSAAAVLAPFVRMEREHGSLITAVMARSQACQAAGHPPEPIFTTLRSGLSTLVDRLAAALPGTGIVRQAQVTRLTHEPAGWRLSFPGEPSAGPHSARPHSAGLYDAVILATPAHVTRALLTPLVPEAEALLSLDATSAIVVALAWEASAAAQLRRNIPRGFGFLVPPADALSDEPTLLAGTFMDQKFPFRAPQGSVLLRGFFGGRAAPCMMDWPDHQIAESARAQFARFVGPLPPPAHAIVRRWPRSLPQYAVGHPARMAALAEHVSTLPHLQLVGNAYYGVGLPNLIEHGRSTARALALALACSPLA